VLITPLSLLVMVLIAPELAIVSIVPEFSIVPIEARLALVIMPMDPLSLLIIVPIVPKFVSAESSPKIFPEFVSLLKRPDC